MIFKKLFLGLFSFLLYVFSSSSSAQEAIQDSIKLDEIVVIGTRTAVDRNNVPLTVSVITQKQIEESSESALLPVLSEQVPGIFITERGITGFGVATGSAGSINIRGVGGNPNTETLVLLNGNPQFAGIMGHPLPDAYVASDVEKVEIIRGPASTLYGTNAMGGVINIITKEQNINGLNVNARSMFGSYNTQKYMLNSGLKLDRFSVFFSFNHDQTKGHRDSSDFKINNGYLRFGYNINSNLNLNADFSLANFDATDPGPVNGYAGYSIDIIRGMGAFSLNNKFENSNGSARFFYNYGDHKITDGFHSKDKNFGIITYQSFNFIKGNTVTFGVDYKRYGGIAENVKAANGKGMIFGDKTISEIAGYGFIQQSLLDRFIINFGLRLENNSVFGKELVPSGGFAFHLTNSTTLKTSVAKGFRSPTIRELYLFAPANEELKPESMINYEVGILQNLFNSRIVLELTAYKAKGENLISTVIGPFGPKNQNTGEFSNQGLEFSGKCWLTDNLSLLLNYSFINMDNPIVATPKHQLFLSSTYRFNKLSVNISLQHINNLYTQTSPSLIEENYTLLNARISYIINKYADVFVKGENLTSQKYYINLGYPMPGFVTFGGINLHY
jgi:outer membrane cobalamin receptor